MDSEGAVEQMAIGAADRPSEYGLDDQPEDDMVLVGEVSSHQIGSPGIEATLDADAVRMSPGKTDQRPAVTLGSKEEEQAATKIQAAQRGWKAHAEVQEMRRGEEAADHSDDANEAIPLIPGAPEEERAAAGIQAVQGGRMGSPRGASAAPEAGQGVATEQGMLQDTQTGQSTECGDSASLPLMVKAVIRIQSIVRGNRDRKKAHLTANPPSAPHTPTLLSSEQDSFFGDFGEEYFPEYDADDEARIIKVQSLQRGRAVRNNLAAGKGVGDEVLGGFNNAAVVKIQALQRGRMARDRVKMMSDPPQAPPSPSMAASMWQPSNDIDLDEDLLAEHDEAAVVKIQALQRGRMARRQTQNTHDPEKKFHDDVVDPFEDAVKQEQAASTQLVGNVTDPRLGEAQWNNDDDGQEYDEAAITKIQAVQRGRQARARAHSLRFSGCEKIPRQLTPPARQKFRSPSSSLDGSPSRRIGRPVAVVADPDVMRDKMARTDVNRPSQLARTKSKLVPVSETEEAKLGELDEAEVRFGEGILEPGGNSPEGMEGDKAGGDEAAQEHTSCLGPNEEVMRESAAAARIEAAARGGAAGEEEAALHEEPKPASDAQQNDAATKIQAVQRGRLARRQAARIRAEKMQQEKAAISMQAAEREVQARKAIMLEQQNKAATKIQAAERRRVARRQVAEMRKERADWEAIERGRRARQEISAMLLLDQRPTRAETPPDAAGAVERVQQAMSNIEELVRKPNERIDSRLAKASLDQDPFQFSDEDTLNSSKASELSWMSNRTSIAALPLPGNTCLYPLPPPNDLRKSSGRSGRSHPGAAAKLLSEEPSGGLQPVKAPANRLASGRDPDRTGFKRMEDNFDAATMQAMLNAKHKAIRKEAHDRQKRRMEEERKRGDELRAYLDEQEERRTKTIRQREKEREMQRELRRRKIEEDKRRRAENLEKIRQLNAAPKRNRTLYHRMETDYERKARQEEEQRRNAVLEERHHIYKHPNPEEMARREEQLQYMYAEAELELQMRKRREQPQYLPDKLPNLRTQQNLNTGNHPSGTGKGAGLVPSNRQQRTLSGRDAAQQNASDARQRLERRQKYGKLVSEVSKPQPVNALSQWQQEEDQYSDHTDPAGTAAVERSGLGGETSGLYRANKPAPLQVHENTELGGITRGIPEKYPIPVQMSNSKSHSMTYIESPGHSYSSEGMHSYDMESASPTTRKQRHSPLFASPDNGPSQVHGLESMDMDPGGGWEEFGDPQSLSSAGGASSVWSLGVKGSSREGAY